MPRGSITAPEMMWAPISLPFSRTAIGEIFIQFAKLIGGGKTGRPTADDQNVDFQNVALGHILRISHEL